MSKLLRRANSDSGLPATSLSFGRTTSSQPTRGSWVDKPDIPPTRREGWLHKNHRGQEVAKGKLRRWFVSDGFHVEYYESDALHKRMGRFDLRNVIRLGPSADPDVAQGVDLQLSETAKGTVTKTVTVSFEGLEPSEVSGWSTLWSSAVSVDFVDEAMCTKHRNEVLAHHLNQICWAQGAKMSSVRREMSSGGGGGRRGSSGVLQSPRAPDFAPSRRDSYSRKQLSQAATALPPASSGPESPPATPRSSTGSASSRGTGEPASPVHAPPSRTSSLPVGVMGPPASPDAAPPQPPRTASLPMGSTRPGASTTTRPAASVSFSASQPAASATRFRGRSFSGASRRLSLSDIRRLHRQLGCRPSSKPSAAPPPVKPPDALDAVPSSPPRGVGGGPMASPLPLPIGEASGASVSSAGAGPSALSPRTPGPSALSPRTPSAALAFRPDTPASLTKALAAAAAAANPSSSTGHLSDEDVFDFDELLGRSADPDEAVLDETADDAGEEVDDGDVVPRVASPGMSKSKSVGRVGATTAPGASTAPPLSKRKSGACAGGGEGSSSSGGGNVGAAGGTQAHPQLRSRSVSLSFKDLDQQSRKSLGLGDVAPDAIDPQAEARALRRYTRPRMGSSTTLWVPGIERLAADLGAGRLRVAVPDGLGAGEELTAVCPDGRHVPLRLPEGNGERVGRQLIFFLDMPKVIWQ